MRFTLAATLTVAFLLAGFSKPGPAFAEDTGCKAYEGLLRVQLITEFSFQSDTYNVASIHGQASPRLTHRLTGESSGEPEKMYSDRALEVFDENKGTTRTVHCFSLPREGKTPARADLESLPTRFRIGVGSNVFELSLPQLGGIYSELEELSDAELAAGERVVLLDEVIDLTGQPDPNWLIPLEAKLSDRPDGTQSLRIKLFNPASDEVRDIGMSLSMRRPDYGVCASTPNVRKGEIYLRRDEAGSVSASATELSFDEVVPVGATFELGACMDIIALTADLGKLPPVQPGEDLYIS